MPPAGIDLEYDPAFLALDALARGNPERQFEALAEPTAWPDVLEASQALLAKSKDLRIGVVYARAASRVHGLAGFHAGLRLLTGLFERYWDTLYPPLDADDDNDPALRVNALAPSPMRTRPSPKAKRCCTICGRPKCAARAANG